MALIFQVTPSFKAGKPLTNVQKRSSMFSEAPQVAGKILRKGSPPLVLSVEQFKACEQRIRMLFLAEAIEIKAIDGAESEDFREAMRKEVASGGVAVTIFDRLSKEWMEEIEAVYVPTLEEVMKAGYSEEAALSIIKTEQERADWVASGKPISEFISAKHFEEAFEEAAKENIQRAREQNPVDANGSPVEEGTEQMLSELNQHAHVTPAPEPPLVPPVAPEVVQDPAPSKTTEEKMEEWSKTGGPFVPPATMPLPEEVRAQAESQGLSKEEISEPTEPVTEKAPPAAPVSESKKSKKR